MLSMSVRSPAPFRLNGGIIMCRNTLLRTVRSYVARTQNEFVVAHACVFELLETGLRRLTLSGNLGCVHDSSKSSKEPLDFSSDLFHQ